MINIQEDKAYEEQAIQQTLREDQVNPQLTEQIQNNEQFKNFMKWCEDNGLLKKYLLAPAAFGPLGVVGIAAAEDIPANTIIACIPNKMMISLDQVKEGEFKDIINENPEIFDEEQNAEAEFNIIAMFIIYEKLKELKGDQSFYKPYFDTIQRSYTMYDWTKEEVQMTECEEIIQSFNEYCDDFKENCEMLQECLIKYPQYFKKEEVTYELITWTYELIMTRIFGYSLPCTCLVPFGDLFNHGNHSCTHYIVNYDYEKEESKKAEFYKIKKRKLNMEIFNDDNLLFDQKNYYFQSPRLKFVKKNKNVIKDKQNIENIDNEIYLEDKILKDLVIKINSFEIQNNLQAEIWDLFFGTTSQTEDNDTDEDVQEKRTQEYKRLQEREVEQAELILQKRFLTGDNIKENLKVLKLEKNGSLLNPNNGEKILQKNAILSEEEQRKQQLYKNININKNILQQFNAKQKEEEEVEADEENESEEEDEEENEDEKGEENKNEDEDNKKTLKESKKINIQQNEQKSDKKQENKNTEEKNDSAVKGEYDNSQSSVSDDSKWDWYDNQDQNTYFAISTEKPIKKGEQVFLCYGRRTNKFLLQWYGFAFPNNLYDSFGFRMWIKPDYHELETLDMNEIIILRPIIEQDWKNGFIMHQNNKIKVEELTKEFRLKRNIICMEFVLYLRVYLINHFHEIDQNYLLVTIPVSIKYEIFIFNFALRILNNLRGRYSTTQEQDQQILKDSNINYKVRFAVTLRYEHKQFIDEHITIIKQILNILNELQTNKSIKDAYMKNYENYENFSEVLGQRKKIKVYLKQLYESQKRKYLND